MREKTGLRKYGQPRAQYRQTAFQRKLKDCQCQSQRSAEEDQGLHQLPEGWQGDEVVFREKECLLTRR